MKKLLISLSLLLLFIAAIIVQPNNWQTVEKVFSRKEGIEKQLDWQEVEKIFGRKGTVQDEVFKVTFPRSDMKVKLGDVSIEPGLALTSWIAFKRYESHTMMMGDLVLLHGEVAPVLSKLSGIGIDVTALHNHLIGETPSVMYLHIEGHGDPTALAKALKDTLALTGTPLAQPFQTQQSSVADWTRVETIMGRKGHSFGNLLQLGIPRAETITENKIEIPSAMGLATAINFQVVGTKAATAGDFVLLANEVNPVVRTLTEHGITVTAVHNHMLFESPRLFFLHFWGYDDPEKLARGLKAALDNTNHVK